MSKVSEEVLGDLARYKDLKSDAKNLISELVAWQKDQFDEWSRDIQELIDENEKSICLETSGKLMELDHRSGKLTINYGERLVTLIREVSTLTSLSFSIPKKISHVADTGKKFYKYGNILKQVANFYNTIDQQMLQSQKAMMLDSARAFERIIKNPKHDSKSKGSGVQVTWDNPDQLEDYIKKLQAATDRLQTENRRLRKCHYTIADKAGDLMGIDLLKYPQKWKDHLMEIRHIMATLISQGFVAENMIAWRAHWDRQLYKSLEHQYQMGVESLNESLPEITVELTFKQQKLQFKPPFEEIQAKYFREMKKFLGIPNHFKGVSEPASTIFSAIIDRNASAFIGCYIKAADLFQRLMKVQNEFSEWVVLGYIPDMDDFVDKELKNIGDWERELKALKVRGRNAEKLKSEYKVDCIRVSTIPVKLVIEEHITRLFDALLSSLRRSISKEVESIDTFLTEAIDTLSVRPQTVEEIGEANGKHGSFKQRKREVKFR